MLYFPEFRSLTALLLTTMALAQTSCKKFVDVQPPPYQLTASTVFAEDGTALSAITGLYMKLPDYLTAYHTANTGLYADELDVTGPSDVQSQLAQSALSDDNSEVASLWSDSYNFVFQTNACIAGLRQSATLTPSLKDQLLGEALFWRAFSYFYLVNYFGDVPLVLSADYSQSSVLPRSPAQQVYDQVSADLQEARSLLVAEYPSGKRVRVNKWAATALAARVYLFEQKWDSAAAMAGSVIGSGDYEALPALSDVFLTTSPEAVLQLDYYLPDDHFGSGSQESYTFLPGSPDQIPSWFLRSDLISAFEPGDNRLSAWTGSNTVDGVTYYYPAKYKSVNGAPPDEYYVVLRLAEQLLIRAEALAQQHRLTESLADLDAVRSRAGLPLISAMDPGISQDSLLSVIYHEKQIEFFAEQGHRWFDLKRTGRADGVLGALKPSTWKATGVLWPIPRGEQELNPFLTANPGYN